MLTLTNIGRLVTYVPESKKVETFTNVEVHIDEGRVKAVGKGLVKDDDTYDCQGRLVTPGFVDPHTHPVFLDGRQSEFALRLQGVSYEEIARQGGGIRSSLQGVRLASEEELVERVTRRMDRFLALGTTNVEAKSGYGLDLESELKSLRVLKQVNETHPVDIVPTFLGAHAFPPEFKDQPDRYVDYLVDEVLPAVAEENLAVYCDVFCEQGYFSVAQSRRLLNRAKELGLKPRLHADEFRDSGAAELAAEVGAVSADHLMAVSARGIHALAKNHVIATLLPGTTFFLGQHSYAPARELIDAGVSVALATDFNPGSCYLQSMPFIMSLACLYLHLTVEEAFQAATYTAAKALDITNDVGHVTPGAQADLIVWGFDDLMELPYLVTNHPIQAVVKRGKVFTPDYLNP
jgi:imidazolonepropionase